ncbi:MAG: 3-hydroxyacyl-CoA dehydrogenase [Pseudomonadota bacterium]|nr:3-hydroxyacyl-CoA dehydrogenase [Pseudomonadota bacterium]
MFQQSTVIGVVGAGAMGAGIAQVAAQAGHSVVALDQDDAALARGRVAVEKSVEALIRRGKLTPADAAALKDRISWTLDIAEMKPASLVIEAIVENEEAKLSLFRRLEETVSATAALATNTSSLSVTALAARLQRPQRFLGLHFFNPAPVMKLVEVVAGAATDAAIARAAEALMRGWGKEAVATRDVPGFIVNRVARPFYGEGWRALEEGAADAATIDFLFRDLAGFRMGPLELGDLIGHDVNAAVARSIYEAYFGRTRFAPSLGQGQLVAAGLLGRKSGRGIYDYSVGPSEPRFAAPSEQKAVTLNLGRGADALKALLDSGGASYGEDKTTPSGFASVDGVLVGFSEGWTAGAFAHDFGRPVVLLDWVRDAKAATAVAFAASDDEARLAALAFAGACGKQAIELKDRPGLVVLRALLQLANAACDAARDLVSDADGIDRAMRFGVNYPFGPLEWAMSYGPARAVAALDAIGEETGEAMYFAGEFLRAAARR